MNAMEQILPYIPLPLRQKFAACDQEVLAKAEEIRFRNGMPIVIRDNKGDYFLHKDSGLTTDVKNSLCYQADWLLQMVMLLSESSFYAFEEELRRGYITLPGGHRAGLCGRAVLEGGRIRTLKDISSINLRIAHQVPLAATTLLPHLFKDRLCNTLIVSPPRAGKTTMLRDIAYQLSEGIIAEPLNVAIVDERSEIAAMRQGVPQLAIGSRSDVLDACPKAEGLMLLIRSMSPQVLICDEIGREEDALALQEAANAGIVVIASAHGADKEEIKARPVLGKLLAEKSFERIVTLSRRHGPGTIEAVWDADFNMIG